MKITKYMTGPIQANTYLVCDEETKKGFILNIGPEIYRKKFIFFFINIKKMVFLYIQAYFKIK